MKRIQMIRGANKLVEYLQIYVMNQVNTLIF